MSQQLTLAMPLNHTATLAEFIWGENTLLQQQLSLSLYQGGERFFYLWGEASVGKSHLLQALCQAMTEAGKSAAYLSLSLLNEWGPDSIEGLEHHDLLAIDEIDAIAGKPDWEEALFHLYNRLRDQGKTVVLIAGRTTPAASAIAMPDLRSRLAWGLIFQMKELSDALKLRALQQHAQKRGFHLSEDAGLFLISRSARNMHALHDILNRLDKASLEAQRKITIPFIKAVLKI